jgi:hypothetical protein
MLQLLKAGTHLPATTAHGMHPMAQEVALASSRVQV